MRTYIKRPSRAIVCGPTVLLLLLTLYASAFAAGVRFDFDGDARADLSVFRPANGWWYFYRSSDGFRSRQFGQSGDRPVAHDYDGDGKTDPAVFRQGMWYRLKSTTSTFDAISWGEAGDIPVPADFDRDGRADTAIFRPATGQWFTILSQGHAFIIKSFGANGDIPIPADFDGDQIADVAVFRPSNGTWYRTDSKNGGSYIIRQFGQSGDVPLAGDFDADGRSDLAVWRPSDSNWYIQTIGGDFRVVNFGVPTDTPVPADYDGDGRTDVAVYRPSNGNWYRINSATSTFYAQSFGEAADIPAPSPTSSHSVPQPTPTPTPTPTATPTPTPPTFACDYYASATGTAATSGSISSPWDLQTALGKTQLVKNGKTLCLRGGTYVGKYRSQLSGAVVRSAPGEWARIDGYKTTTLPIGINSSQTTFSLQSASGILDGGTDEFVIGGEVIKAYSKSGNNITGSLRGASNSLNGAEPHASGSIVVIGGNALEVYGSNSVYRDFEIMNSRPGRDGNIENQGIGRGTGISVFSNGTKLINLIVHDNGGGIGTGSGSSNTEIYGCLVFNNGIHSRDGTTSEKPHGHGMYLQNMNGYSRVYENVVLNNFNLGLQGYGATADYVGGDIQGSIFFNSGSPMRKFKANFTSVNLLVGPESVPSPTLVLKLSHVYQPITGTGVNIGYGSGVSNATITDNYFVGGETPLQIGNVTYAQVMRNRIYSPISFVFYTHMSPGQRTWDQNIYYGAEGKTAFAVMGVMFGQFAQWRQVTGYDQAGMTTSGAMPDTVMVRPNAYQPGRANVVIYSFSGATTASIDLSTTGLTNGQSFVIRNTQNYFGPIVASGTYSSSNPVVSVSLVGPAQSVAAPIGHGYTPASTCPQFCPMIVTPQ